MKKRLKRHEKTTESRASNQRTTRSKTGFWRETRPSHLVFYGFLRCSTSAPNLRKLFLSTSGALLQTTKNKTTLLHSGTGMTTKPKIWAQGIFPNERWENQRLKVMCTLLRRSYLPLGSGFFTKPSLIQWIGSKKRRCALVDRLLVKWVLQKGVPKKNHWWGK